MTNEQLAENSRQAMKVLRTVEQIMKADGNIEPIWYRGKRDGYYACIPDAAQQVEYKVPGPTELDAACRLLAKVRELYPDATEATEFDAEGYAGLEVYSDWNDAKIAGMQSQLAEMRA